MLVCVVLSEGPGAPAGVWGPSRRGGAVVTSPFFRFEPPNFQSRKKGVRREGMGGEAQKRICFWF